MADKIFLRGKAWYRASEKQLPDDIDMGEIIANPSAQYPEIETDGDGGGSQTLQQTLDEGSVLTGDNTILSTGNLNIQLDNNKQIDLLSFSDDANSEAEVFVYANADPTQNTVGIYVFNNNTNDDVFFQVTPTSATINKNGAGNKEIATVNYLVYTALLSQSGTDAPVATVLENTLGGTVVWTRDSEGYYLASLAGVFLDGKSGGLISATGNIIGRDNNNAMGLTTLNVATGVNADSQLLSTTIEIRVYP